MSDKFGLDIVAGSTDVSIPCLFRSTTDNTEVTGKVHTDVTGSYLRQGGTRTGITMATLAAVNSAHSDGGFTEIDGTNQPGLYRADIPDAAFASGADWVVVSFKIAGAFVFHQQFHLRATVPSDAAANVAAIKAKTDNLPSDPAGLAGLAAAHGAGSWATATGFATPTNVTDARDAVITQIDANEAKLDTIAGYIDTEVAAIKDVTDKLDTGLEADGAGGYQFTTLALANGPSGGDATAANQSTIINHLTDIKGGTFSGATDSLEAIRNQGDSAWATATGFATPTNVTDARDAVITQIDANEAKLDTIAGYIDTEVAAIKDVTDKLDTGLEADGAGGYQFTTLALANGPSGSGGDATAANQSTIIADLATIAGYIDTEVAAIKAKTDNLPSDPAGLAGLAAAHGAGSWATATGFATPTNVTDARDAVITQIDTVITNQATIAGYIDTEVAAIKAVTDKLDTGLEADGAGGYQFTTLALANAPGGGSTIENTVVISAAAPSLTAISSGGTITIHRGDLTTFQLTGLGSLAGRTGQKLYFTAKRRATVHADDDDTAAIIQISETTGAIRVNGAAAASAGYASLVVDDEDDGDITITLQHQLTDILPLLASGVWDVQLINASGKPRTLTAGRFDVAADVTRANS